MDEQTTVRKSYVILMKDYNFLCLLNKKTNPNFEFWSKCYFKLLIVMNTTKLNKSDENFYAVCIIMSDKERTLLG